MGLGPGLGAHAVRAQGAFQCRPGVESAAGQLRARIKGQLDPVVQALGRIAGQTRVERRRQRREIEFHIGAANAGLYGVEQGFQARL